MTSDQGRDGGQGAVLAVARGRVLAPRRPPPPRGEVAEGPALWRTLVFLALLPLFGETFQYIVDVDPLYRLAKVWPLLTLPLAAWGLVRLDLPYKAPLLLACGWVFGVAPLIGVWQLGNLIGGALATTFKVWALTCGFSAAASLAILRPSPSGLRWLVIALGAVTFLSLIVIKAAAPPEAYFRTIEQTKIFLFDEERGRRVNVPMFLGLLSLFTLARAFWARPRWWQPALMAGFLYLMITIFKERLPILGAAAVILLSGILSSRWRVALVAILLTAGGLAAYLYLVFHAETLADSLGGSLTYRQAELSDALAFLNAQPLRWIVGAGSASRIGDVSLAGIVGSDYFFLADLGWLGVVFEYGVVGAVLLFVLLASCLATTWRVIRPEEPLSGAAFDYVLYVLLASPVASVVMAPGEAMTCAAIAWYLASGRPASGPIASASGRLTPRRFAPSGG